MIDDATLKKRRRDLADDAEAAFDTTAEEDARLRQTHLYGGTSADPSHGDPDTENDAYLEQAERITRSLEKSDGFKYSGQFRDPEKRREFVEQLAEELRGENGQPKPTRPQEPKEERWSSDKFWNSDEPGKVMPKKL